MTPLFDSPLTKGRIALMWDGGQLTLSSSPSFLDRVRLGVEEYFFEI